MHFRDLTLHFFEDLSRIPRGSHNEAGVSDALVNFAMSRELQCYRDQLDNVLIEFVKELVLVSALALTVILVTVIGTDNNDDQIVLSIYESIEIIDYK